MYSQETITLYLKWFLELLYQSQQAGNNYTETELIDTLLGDMQHITNQLYLSAKAELLTRCQRNVPMISFADVEA